ncbi:malto-oligosyltrehalose synthase [Paraburkholderia acidicola]|uniref:Malto-oligosyltrehalose synthase n=1 Tax=Paraburkholderia acidicola TaxID=1912599 RepID=A0ABV1LYJ3_9BURK
MTAPRATLRLQFHRNFTFDDALAQLDYFAMLGVSHLYASPITTAQPGSLHGYDTVDYSQVSEECGGEAALKRLADALHARGMGLIVDVVPNHMGVGGAHNVWWLDILEWGRHSAYARHFDVDWHSPDPALRGKVLVPFLGGSYGDELNAGNIVLRFAPDSGRLLIGYGEHVCPVCPVDYPSVLQAANHADLNALAERFVGLTTQPTDHPRAAAARDALRDYAAQHGTAAIEAALQTYVPAAGEAADSANALAARDRLHRLLERQHFRLAWWRTASDEVNWRRFFDIGALAGVRVERSEVFEAVHALIFRLYAEGTIDGVRIDHIDGLAEPREYCQRLRQRLMELRSDAPYLVVEKILARDETLREDWPVDGTTGYDFMNDVGALLHDPAGAEPLAATWAELSGRSALFADEALAARRKMLAENLSAELDRAARALHRIARESTTTRDFTFTAIRRVLAELVAHFPVYRIYPQNGVRSETDNVWFDAALEAAKRVLPLADHAVLERVDAWLGRTALDGDDNGAPGNAGATQNSHAVISRRTAQTIFAQVTAPVAAKAIEDTAGYRYGRLLSRNEVGSDPGEFALTVEQFHATNLARARRFPHALLATATHDHKRGEDLRARLAVLSEIAHDWSATLRRWSTLNAPHRRMPDASAGARAASGNESDHWAPGAAAEALLYQTLVGCWPLDLAPNDAAGIEALAERVAQWQLKALREAKLRTGWRVHDETYEHACRDFLFDILAPQRRDGFLHELSEVVARIARAGAINSLQQTVLRLTSPGVPDLYQGTELWDFSLVDPDNRRPVDFAQRHAWLAESVDAPPSGHLADWRSGRVKVAVVQRGLALRTHLPALLSDGVYLPLEVQGAHAAHAIAFARRHGNAWAVVIATRLAMTLLDPDGDTPWVDSGAWGDTAVVLPSDLASRALFDCLSPAAPKVDDTGLLYLRDALAAMPVAILVEDGVPRT